MDIILFKHLCLKLLKLVLCSIGEAIAITATNRVQRDQGLNTEGGFNIKRDIPIYIIKDANNKLNLMDCVAIRSTNANITITKKTGVEI